MDLYCGKCFEARRVLNALIASEHTPTSELAKPERRDHVRCPRLILTCSWCQCERHPDKTYEVTSTHRNRHGDTSYVTLQHPQVLSMHDVRAKLAVA